MYSLNRNAKKFTFKDAEIFSRISGDFNPIHLSNDFASRSIHGSRIIHGMNVILWSLNIFCEKEKPFGIIDIRIDFKEPIFLHKLVYLEILKKANNIYQFKVFDNHTLKSSFTIIIKKNKYENNIIKNTYFAKVSPNKFNNKILKLEHKSDVNFNKTLAKVVFKNLYAKLNHNVLGSLLKTSKIVGMIYPGKFSTFVSLRGQLNLNFDKLNFVIKKYDERFNFLNIKLSGIINGSIEAVETPKPIKVKPLLDIKDFLKKISFDKRQSFRNKQVLIIGGSRGLGAYLVRILALQGADVMFTYNKSKIEASRLVKELKEFGKKKVTFIKLDVLKNNFNFLSNYTPDQLYYMATTKIGTVENSKTVNTEKLSLFYNIYIECFLNIYNSLGKEKKIKVLYPSSIYVRNKSMQKSEYVIIKKLGETICKELNRQISNKVIYIPKIKPLLTDQHLSIYKNSIKETPDKTIVYLIENMLKLKH